MKITCCLIAKDPMRSKERATWFTQALITTRPFDEVIVLIQGDFDQRMVQSMSPNARILVARDLCAEEAFVYAAKKARNKWVSVGCDDDYYAPDNVRILQQAMDPDPKQCSVIYFPYYIIKPEENSFGVFYPPAPFTMEQLVEVNFISTAAVVHKDVLKKTGGWRAGPAIAGDWDLWVRARKAGFNFGHFPLPIYYQRYYSTSGFQYQVAKVGQEAINQHIREVANAKN